MNIVYLLLIVLQIEMEVLKHWTTELKYILTFVVTISDMKLCQKLLKCIYTWFLNCVNVSKNVVWLQF